MNLTTGRKDILFSYALLLFSFWHTFPSCSPEKSRYIFRLDNVRAMRHEKPFSLNLPAQFPYVCYHSILSLHRNASIVLANEIRRWDFPPSRRFGLIAECRQSLGSKTIFETRKVSRSQNLKWEGAVLSLLTQPYLLFCLGHVVVKHVCEVVSYHVSLLGTVRTWTKPASHSTHRTDDPSIWTPTDSHF